MPIKIPDTLMTDDELKVVKQVATALGISEDEAHTDLVKSSLARRVRRNTGKAPAKVYSIRGRK